MHIQVAIPSLDSLDSSTQELRDISLELWAAQDKLDLFQMVFYIKKQGNMDFLIIERSVSISICMF